MAQGVRCKYRLALVALLASALHAQNSPGEPPSAASVFARYVSVTGGQAAYDRIENQVTAVTVTRDGQVLAHATFYQTRGGDFLAVEVDGDKTTETGVHAGVVWRKTPETAELLETDEQRGAVLRDAFLLPPGDWRRFYTGAVFETGAEIDGKSCFQVAATPFIGALQRLYFDDDSGLLVRQDVDEPAGYTEIRFDDYFDAGGIRVARKEILTINQVSAVLTLDSVQFNQPIPAETFALPAEIARLVQKKSGR
jgi:hypothetical protein